MTALFSRGSVAVVEAGETLSVTGDVDVTLAADVAASGVQWLQSTTLAAVTLDFSQVDKASSVAISVLFEWLRICQQRAISIRAIHLSAPLLRLASLAELDDLIEHPAATLGV